MSALRDKKIVLGITGSIAAYKCAILVRLLVKRGAEVRVVMTDAAKAFVAPLTLSTLSKHEVIIDLFEDDAWHNHVELGLWADLMIIAPATANTMSKMAAGEADNMLLATYLSAKCPVFIAPAMDLDMWKHGSTKDNLTKLRSYGNHVIPVGHGELASGLIGEGRMAEPEDICAYLENYIESQQALTGRTALVTAGPTREHIDPVRFLSNPSTGKMGISLADALAEQGAKVNLVLGPSHHRPASSSVHVTHVISAQEMYEACAQMHADADIVIFAAAVADYRPTQREAQKMKKSDEDLSIPLERTVDIAATLGAHKKDQIHVGFALETQNGLENAKGKLQRKNFDLIALNSPSENGTGFGHDTNQVSLIGHNIHEEMELKSKKLVAKDIVAHIIKLL